MFPSHWLAAADLCREGRIPRPESSSGPRSLYILPASSRPQSVSSGVRWGGALGGWVEGSLLGLQVWPEAHVEMFVILQLALQDVPLAIFGWRRFPPVSFRWVEWIRWRLLKHGSADGSLPRSNDFLKSVSQ